LSLLSAYAYGDSQVKLTVLYNNIPFNRSLKTDWGFSCLVQGMEKTILFDTGSDGDILLSNMKTLGLDPGLVDLVVISHTHSDHTWGLWELLSENANVTFYVPGSFPSSFQEKITQAGAGVISVSAPTEIIKGVYTTGEMGETIVEQSLVVESEQGLILITGCAHPGIVEIAGKAKEIGNQRILLAMGGFHLMGYGTHQLRTIAAELAEIGIKKIAPSHCTGADAIRIFRELWKDDFVDGGCGATVVIP
jgi:7,8-dihydropterin-6-yl-methyl-4-(beta-D-ribofuranosyl)aminobenzene 5'-phosphate synthase